MSSLFIVRNCFIKKTKYMESYLSHLSYICYPIYLITAFFSILSYPCLSYILSNLITFHGFDNGSCKRKKKQRKKATYKTWIPRNLSFRYIYCTGQFTLKMKENAEHYLFSSLVWIDSGVVVSQHRLGFFFHEIKCNGMTSFMEFMKSH